MTSSIPQPPAPLSPEHNTRIYIIAFASRRPAGDYYKIGIAGDIADRLRRLQGANPFRLVLVWASPWLRRGDARSIEAAAHRAHDKYRMQVASQREWFLFNSGAAAGAERFLGEQIATVAGIESQCWDTRPIKPGEIIDPVPDDYTTARLFTLERATEPDPTYHGTLGRIAGQLCGERGVEPLWVAAHSGRMRPNGSPITMRCYAFPRDVLIEAARRIT